MITIQKTKDLVKSRITGNRKWSDTPCYLHSYSVYESLKSQWYSHEIQEAWLLHDIIEDGNTTLQELKELWYSDEVVHLVDLASHDASITQKYPRRAAMMQRILDEDNIDAFIIKLADYHDNLKDCLTMPEESKRNKFLQVKWAFFAKRWHYYAWESQLYKAFLDRYHHQINILYPLFPKKTYKVVNYDIWKYEEDDVIQVAEFDTREEAELYCNKMNQEQKKSFTSNWVFDEKNYWFHWVYYAIR